MWLYFGPQYISISIFFRSRCILGLGDALSLMHVIRCSSSLLSAILDLIPRSRAFGLVSPCGPVLRTTKDNPLLRTKSRSPAKAIEVWLEMTPATTDSRYYGHQTSLSMSTITRVDCTCPKFRPLKFRTFYFRRLISVKIIMFLYHRGFTDTTTRK